MSQHFIPLDIVFRRTPDADSDSVKDLLRQLNSKPGIDLHISENESQSGFCVHYNPEHTTLSQVKALLMTAGVTVEARYQDVTFTIRGMDCTDCVRIIEHTLNAMPGVLTANVGYASGLCRLTFDRKQVKLKRIRQRLAHFGYQSELMDKPASWWHRYAEFAFSITAGVLLLCGWLSMSDYPLLSQSLLILSFLSGGLLSFRDSVQTLWQRRVDIELLMVLAAIGAAILGEWVDASLLLFLFSFGHALEHKAMHRAKSAIKSLTQLVPDTAEVIRQGQTVNIAVTDLVIGDVVIIKAGERIAIDGNIIAGSSEIDQSPMTGESIPVDKQSGDAVFAGCINGSGLLKVSVTNQFKDNTLQRMIKLVLEADTQKSPSMQLTEKFVTWFVPLILIGVGLLILIPPMLGGSWSAAFYRAMAVLVAASPCALAIATPAAIISGVARAAQQGVLIKGGRHLENLGALNAIAFDKTGTLTKGKPSVQTVITLSGARKDWLTLAASLESFSAHPLAQAVVSQAQEDCLTLEDVQDVQSISGKGMQGKINGKTLAVGNVKLFDTVPQAVLDQAQQVLNQGQTLMLVAYDNVFLGIIGLADTIRPETKQVLSALRQQGMEHIIMLTGDHQLIAERIAEQLNITEVKADLLPLDKLQAIQALEINYGCIGMVGDGVNDAPAMAAASVGIAMGAAGSDVALEASDIALMADDLSQLPFAIRLSRQALSTIRLNLVISLSMVFVLLVLTSTGISGIGPAIIAHEGSTLIVVFNALRLLYFK